MQFFLSFLSLQCLVKLLSSFLLHSHQCGYVIHLKMKLGLFLVFIFLYIFRVWVGYMNCYCGARGQNFKRDILREVSLPLRPCCPIPIPLLLSVLFPLTPIGNHSVLFSFAPMCRSVFSYIPLLSYMKVSMV